MEDGSGVIGEEELLAYKQHRRTDYQYAVYGSLHSSPTTY